MHRCVGRGAGHLHPDPVRAVDKPSLLPIENVFTIEGCGTVVTGKIEQGIIRAGDSVGIVAFAEAPRTIVRIQVKTFSQVSDGCAPQFFFRTADGTSSTSVLGDAKAEAVTMRLVWLTDLHLNFVTDESCKDLLVDEIKATSST